MHCGVSGGNNMDSELQVVLEFPAEFYEHGTVKGGDGVLVCFSCSRGQKSDWKLRHRWKSALGELGCFSRLYLIRRLQRGR